MKVEDLTDEQDEQFCQIISDAFGIEVFSYNSKVTEEFWGVLDYIATNESAYTSNIASYLELTESHVELIQYLLCNNDHAEYGTSPRGCWLTEKGMDVWRTLRLMLDLPIK